MKHSLLLIVGMIWLAMVLIWLFWGPSIALSIKSPLQVETGQRLFAWLWIALYVLLLLGWILPLGYIGVIHFLRRH